MSTGSQRHRTESTHHIVRPQVYIAVFIALLVLTAITVAAAAVDLEAEFGLAGLNVIVALAIAVVKASLVVLFFMNVRHSTPLLRLAVAIGFVWFGIMIAFTMSDFMSREWGGLAVQRTLEPAVTDPPGVPTDNPTAAPQLPTTNPAGVATMDRDLTPGPNATGSPRVEGTPGVAPTQGAESATTPGAQGGSGTAPAGGGTAAP